MLVDIKSNTDVIENGQFVKEPILRLKEKILGSDAKRIITTGGYGVGKSITLFGIQHLSLPTDDKVVATTLKRQIKVPEGYDEEEFLRYYFDVKYSEYLKKRLKPVSKEKMQSSSILKELGEIDERSRTLYEIERGYSEPKDISSLMLGDAIEEAKRITGAERISVAVDDFDLNPKTENGQRILIDTLNCFDKTIIGINPNSLTGEEQKRSLESHGYEIIDIDYCNDPKVLLEIVRRRIVDPENRGLIYTLDYDKLINASSGDTLSILKAIEKLENKDDTTDIYRLLETSMEDSQKNRDVGKMLLR